MGWDGEIRWMDPRGVVRTAIWSLLLPVASGCHHDEPTSDPLADALDQGCWQRSFDVDPYELDYDEDDGGDEEEWEPFSCDLPIVCDPILIDVSGVTDLSAEQVAANEVGARCMLEALRDGTPAVHTVEPWPLDPEYGRRVTYHVLPDGIVGFDANWDGGVRGRRETFRRARPDAFFDECLAREHPEECLLQVYFPPLDPEACIDDVPRCPD